MKARDIAALLSPAGWAALVALVAGLLAIGWWVVVAGPAHERSARVAAQANVAQAQGYVLSAGEAAVITDQAHDQAAAIEDLSRRNADAIQHAPGADQRLDPELNRLARQRLCERAAYRGRPECVQPAGGAKPPH